MKVIRQDHNRFDCKRALTTAFAKCSTERIDVIDRRR